MAIGCLTMTYNNLGMLYKLHVKYQKATVYFKETLQIELFVSRLAQENEDFIYFDDVNREGDGHD